MGPKIWSGPKPDFQSIYRFIHRGDNYKEKESEKYLNKIRQLNEWKRWWGPGRRVDPDRKLPHGHGRKRDIEWLRNSRAKWRGQLN